MHPYSNINLSPYYIQQAGSGFNIYRGNTPQHGYGLFSNAFRRFGIPLIKFLGKQGVNYISNVRNDVLEKGVDLKSALKGQLINSGRNIALDGLARATERVSQFGSGRRRGRPAAKGKARKRRAPAK